MNVYLALLLLAAAVAVQAKTSKWTYYYVVFEEDYPQGSDASIKDCKGGVLAKTSAKFLKDLQVEGSGKLRNGNWGFLKFVNTGGKNCFKYMAPTGNHNNKLVPYISVATKSFKYGTKILVEQMKNVQLPNGKTHNGCVRVDDTGGGLKAGQLDFYVLRKKNYQFLDKKVKTGQVTITEPSTCTLGNYGE